MRAILATAGAWLRRAVAVGVRALLYGALSEVLAIALFALSVVSIALSVVGIGIVSTPVVTTGVRQFANLHRRLAREWAGVDIPEPYHAAPPATSSELVRPESPVVAWRTYRRMMTDPATWRDLLWLLFEMTAGLALSVGPMALIGYGLEGASGLSLLLFWLLGNYGYGAIWLLDTWGVALLTIPQGVVLLVAGLILAPRAPRWHFLLSRSLLAPTAAARAGELDRRVRQLSDTRADAVETQAAELRRIERDLHDGAQARLVGLSLNIGLAAELMSRDPVAARRLLAEAQEASSLALTELRNLVRGIHPPVLAERGLDGAVRALALTVPLPVDVDIALPGRPPAPVESAVYFAVAEALANAVKHARASRVWIRLAYAAGTITAVVGDDGVGGADPDGGGGVTGVRRRLAAFDATMSVASPPGGPTVVTMELPCVLFSPRISPSSGTD